MIRPFLARLAAAGALALVASLPLSAQPLSAGQVMREMAVRSGLENLRSLTTTVRLPDGGTYVRHVARQPDGTWQAYVRPGSEEGTVLFLGMAEQISLSLAGLSPAEVEEGYSVAQRLPDGVMAGRPSFLVALPAEYTEGLALDVGVDRERFHFLGVVMEMTEGDVSTHISVELHDIREVDGVAVPYRLVVRIDNFLAVAGVSRAEAEAAVAELQARPGAQRSPAENEAVRSFKEALLTGAATFTLRVSDVVVNGPMPAGLKPAT